MRAIRCYDYGPPGVLRLEDIETPVPGDDEVLIKVRAASVNPLDWHMMRGEPFIVRMGAGLGRPKDPRVGVDVAGEVEAVGKSVTEFEPGDAVFGGCQGAFAEYACARERALAAKPDNVAFEQAAAVPVAALTALQGLCDKGRMRAGHRVLVNGAAGGVGTFAVQIARALGADVTGVCSTRNVEMVRSIGASRVVDYTREDFTQGGERYDVILDCVGNHPLPALRRALAPAGRCAMAGGPSSSGAVLARALGAVVSSLYLGGALVPYVARQRKNDLVALRGFLAEGKITPVIDRRYALDEVRDAVTYVETGHARGKVVITVD